MQRHLIVGALFLFCISPLSLLAQVQVQTLEQLEQYYPNVRFHENNGNVSMVYGTTLSTGTTPMESAMNHLSAWSDLYGVEPGNFVPQLTPSGETMIGVMPNRATGEYKFYTLRLNQELGGLPVFRSGVGFLVRNTANNPVVMTGFDVKELNGFDVAAAGVGEVNVTKAMLKNVRETMNSAPDHGHGSLQSVLEEPVKRHTGSIAGLVRGDVGGDELRILAQRADIEVSNEELVIWAGIDNIPEEPRLAVSFIAQRGSIRTYPHYDKYLIVAAADTGEILLAESQITCFDVEGTVSGRATNGLGSLECHEEIEFPLPYAEVSVEGGDIEIGAVFADVDGRFSVATTESDPVTVTSRLRGQWFEVFDQSSGGAIPEISFEVTPPGKANFIHNPTDGADLVTANVNAYLESNKCRDYILSYEPNFPTINTQQFFNVNTNINSTCNAFYDGSSINFYQAGGGCANTSASDVVYHEYGHHLVSVTGNGQGQFGEGSGDVIGILMDDEPITGNGFEGDCSTGIRTADNNVQYPCSSATFGVHGCGRLLSGAVWSTRNELIATEPSSYRDISASLFLGMMIVRGQMQPGNTTIDPSITVIYLELDDDDSDIGNGTPHYQEIAAGFGAHGLDAPALTLIEFEFPSGRPERISPSGGVAFEVTIEDLIENHDPSTAMLFVDRGNGFEAIPMTEVASGRYAASFPPSDCASELRYYVSADTTNNNTQSSPNGAPIEFFTAMSADSVSTVFVDDFNTDLGWTTAGDAGDGQWERAIPAGGGDRGDPAFDDDGSGTCFVTDNEDGNSDVDDGTTVLTSPLLDASTDPGSIAVIAYSRWYSNDQGNLPEADIFVVDISNDDGATWTNLETVGPSGLEVRGGWFRKSFRIDEFVAPTDQMRLRFTASDFADEGSIVEAAIDAVEIVQIGCAQNVLGDLNGDGEFNNLDLGAFVLALTDPASHAAQFPNVNVEVVADLNGDGKFDNLDIQAFVEALTGGG